MSHLAVRIDKRLLIDSANAFKCANIVRVLRAEIARVRRFDLTAGFIIMLLTLHCSDLRLGQNQAFGRHFIGKRF